MRIIISGGGTGGHIYPAVTIAEQIKKINQNAEIIFVGTKKGLEADIVPRYGYPIEYIEVAGFERKFSLDTLKSLGKLFSGLYQVSKLIGEFKPDLVIGTGGYVCGPVLLWAALRGIPTCIQEQNAMPGVTNKILSHFVDKVFLGYDMAKTYFGGKSKKIFTGNPIREEILTVERDKALQTLELASDKKTILVSGGSRGARSINKAMIEILEKLVDHEYIQVIHITGTSGYREVCDNLSNKVLQASNIKVIPYLHEMPLALAISDLAVFRAGAIGLAELTALGIPSILIPYPYATANHQEFNARALEKQGAAIVILDKDLTGELLLKQMEMVLNNGKKIEEMKEAALTIGRPKAALDIAEQAVKLLKKR